MLEDIEELDIQLELGSIKDMKKIKFKSIVKEKVKFGAFAYLMEKKAARKSDNARGKLLEYSVLEKSEYLTPIEHDFSIEEKKWLLKSRLEDIDIPRKWNNENTICGNCPNIEFNQKHLFECQFLLGKNEIVTYLPNYEDLFSIEEEEQAYISRIIKENLRWIQY